MASVKFSAIDLFCGAGGLTAGLNDAGFKVLAGVEMNSVAAETFRLNHPKVKLYESDIRSLSVKNVLDDLGLEKGELDLLAGCPPCQGFSSHTTRNKASAIKDSRNELIFEFYRFVEDALPKTIMLENVPALAKDWRIVELQQRLKDLGYLIDKHFAEVKNAADFGVPQRRRRLIIKASRFGLIDSPASIQVKKTVRQTFAALPEVGHSGDELHDIIENRTQKVKLMISLVPKDGGSRSDLPKELWLECHKRNSGGYKDVYGRMSWDDVAPTITGGCTNPSKGRFLHPVENRAITLREAALLQTFPKKYKFSMRRGKDAVALMIGNALPPEFIRQHAKMFIRHLKGVQNG